MKKLIVGWMHRSSLNENYLQMKKPIGGTVELSLPFPAPCTANTVVQQAMQEFCKDPVVKLMMSNLVIQLGTYNGGTISAFKCEEAQDNLWTWLSEKNYRSNLYLMTMPTEKVSIPKVADSSTDGTKEVNSISCKQSATASGSREVKFACNKIIHQDFASNQIAKEDDKEQGSTMNFSGESLEVVGAYESCDNFVVLYSRVVYSEYTHEPSISEVDKLMLFQVESGEADFDTSFDKFQPSEYGYDVSRICKDDKILVETQFDVVPVEMEDLKYHSVEKHYSFPSCPNNVAKHEVIYTPDYLHGFCEGEFGIGVIAACGYSCEAMVEWYKDGKLYNKGKRQYWIHNVEVRNVVWTVKTSCIHKLAGPKL